MRFYLLLLAFIVIIITIAIFVWWHNGFTTTPSQDLSENIKESEDNEAVDLLDTSKLDLEYMKKQDYPGSDIKMEQTLPSGSNYKRYVVSYLSEGLKIYALLTVPNGEKPETGWPVIVFNHGYIPPDQYKTTERYVAYTDAFSRNGYIVIKSDYRGNGSSEGQPEGAYYSPAYTVDVLNALTSIKKYPDADPNRIGMWGHSMGGNITLRSMVISKDIKAGVIWGGVVASYEDMTNNWKRTTPFRPSLRETQSKRPSRQDLIDKYGDFATNPTFWNSITPIKHVSEISGPIQLHHATTDEEVPYLFSQKLDEALKEAGKNVEFYTYDGDNHNLSKNLSTALQRSVEFFDQHVKNLTP